MATKRNVSSSQDSSSPPSEKLPPAQAGKKWVKKRRWWNCGPIKCFLLVFVAIFVLNFAALKREEKALLPNGELHDIGWGQRMFMRCTGKGTPVVLLDTPIGETSDVWIKVEPLLSKYTKVCVYDRAGLGFSDRPYKNTSLYANDFSKEAKKRDTLTPGTVERMVDDLHRLINKGLRPYDPIVLVGVDYSTLITRFYTQFYQNDVAGLVFIDPMVETIFDNNSTWSHYWYQRVLSQVNTLYLTSAIGLTRLALLTGLVKPLQDENILKLVNDDFVNRKKYLMCSSSHLSSVMDEIYMTNTSLSQVKTALKVKPFPQEIPVAMATFKDFGKKLEPKLTKEWIDSQTKLQSIHQTMKLYTLPGSDHTTLYHNPQSIANIILNTVQQWKLLEKEK